jgi:hypothetical protein
MTAADSKRRPILFMTTVLVCPAGLSNNRHSARAKVIHSASHLHATSFTAFAIRVELSRTSLV